MAFTFIVEDGTGTLAATSYVSVENADDILVMNVHSSPEWTALTVANKEHLLSWATQILDTQATWFGAKTVSTSALRWPRTGVCDRDGIEIGANIVPRQLEVATAELARFFMTVDRTADRDQDGLDSLKVDVIEIDFWDGYQLATIPNYISSLLIGLGRLAGTSGIGFSRLVR